MPDSLIIIPCYNEANRLQLEVFKIFQEHNVMFDLCFVNDGSKDDTKTVLNTFFEESNNTTVIHLEKNTGKAEAIRHAVLNLAKPYTYVGYLDADLSTPLNEIERLLTLAKTEKKAFVLGSRIKVLGASINRKFYRHFFGRIVATFIDSFILKLEIYDTQCGAKIIETSLAKSIFSEPFKSKWLFDVELLARIKQQYGNTYCKSNILEEPLKQWHDTSNTRISFLDFLKTPLDLIKIYNHYR